MKIINRLKTTIYKLAVKEGYPNQILTFSQYHEVLKKANQNVFTQKKYMKPPTISIMKTMDVAAIELLDSTVTHITSYSETYRDIRLVPGEHLYSEDDILEGIEGVDEDTAKELRLLYNLLSENDCAYLRILTQRD